MDWGFLKKLAEFLFSRVFSAAAASVLLALTFFSPHCLTACTPSFCFALPSMFFPEGAVRLKPFFVLLVCSQNASQVAQEAYASSQA